MDYRGQVESLLYDAKDWAGDPHIRKDLHGAAQSITDLLARAEAAEYEPEQRKEYYDKMVDALAAVGSKELEEAKGKLRAAEARAEEAERERDAAVEEIPKICYYCKRRKGWKVCEDWNGSQEAETCKKWEWRGQKEE